jgi:hypothetical protein
MIAAKSSIASFAAKIPKSLHKQSIHACLFTTILCCRMMLVPLGRGDNERNYFRTYIINGL